MKLRRMVAALGLATLFPIYPAIPQATAATDSCIAFLSENLAKGRNNFYTYFVFSDQRETIREGDVLVYSVLLDPRNPAPKGGIDVSFDDDKAPLRDLHLKDEMGIDVHGDGVLSPAVGKWYDRRIPLVGQQERIINGWSINFEGDEFGKYAQWIDDVAIEHKDGSKTTIYRNGAPPVRRLDIAEGYTKNPFCVVVDRSKVTSGANFPTLVAEAEKQGKKLAALQEARNEIAMVRDFLKKSPDAAVEAHVREAQMLLDAVEQKDASPEEIQAVLHAANHALSHTHPVMRQYTGDLVGHAHIDLQWLWEWQEGMVVTHDTFNQAVKFMDEFPGFTFSQSSSWLYKATEQQYPDLFKKIQQKVKKGQWEIVGGRVCEGDTNMISPESHARQFLYGQRYFREKFGKTARVAWEPDTFGHTAQMPQIAHLGGCDSYYFCRGGKGQPLFWWTALDGTKVLAFDEPATGSWYNSDLSYSQFKEMLDFQDKTGSKDMLWVYGVGNHGGGPTREMIQTALGWMKDPSKPKVQFATATQFFDKLRTYDLKKIPTIKDELNPVFDGCYTSHSEIKQANRSAESMTTAAEAIATIASLRGFAYPKDSFRRNWEEICFNHHHDTLPGSGIHPPYEKTKNQLARVVADDKDIIQRAMESMVVQVTAPKGISQMVFNPTGWKRSGWIECYLVKSGWDQTENIHDTAAAAVAPDGSHSPVEVIDPISHKVRFWAADVPAFGYKVFRFEDAKNKPADLAGADDTIESSRYLVKFDKSRGLITSLYDKVQGRELAGKGLGGLEAHFEGPGGMSAWVIGNISKVEPLSVTGYSVEQMGQQTIVKIDYVLKAHNALSKDTTVTQRFHIDNQSDGISVDVDCDWNAIGTGNEPTPMLRAAFDTALSTPTATYEVPFGSISRPTDNKEYPALQWGDLRDSSGGVAILNDSKHGYSASGSTMRLTLIRASYEPDPVPNPGHHHWRYAIVPHGPDATGATLSRMGTSFNIPLFSASVPYDARGEAPLQWSLFTGKPEDWGTVVTTGLKRAEDDNDVVLRFYEAGGKQLPRLAPGLSLIPKSGTWTNFLEDPLAAEGASPKWDKFGFQVRPFEIRTAKIRF